MARSYSATLFFHGKVVEVACQEGRQPVTRSPEQLDADELAALNCIVECLRCLSSGKEIDHHFNPTLDNLLADEIMECRWETRSGKLKIMKVAERRYMHANTVKEAMARHRNFTAPRSVVQKLPPRRDKIGGDTDE